MIIGAHSIIYSVDAEADRAFFRDVLKFPSVDVGGGWLIFALPPSEVAFHPAEANGKHEFYLMCEDINAFVSSMKKHDVKCSGIHEEHWGRLVKITLPGGGRVGVYQALHERPK
ncbi:MAG: extradiol dioxygenase [Alphaproteobacteria bacterium]|nr:extradiol dioxygenase [Alphaproteobacteria bacterium]